MYFLYLAISSSLLLFHPSPPCLSLNEVTSPSQFTLSVVVKEILSTVCQLAFIFPSTSYFKTESHSVVQAQLGRQIHAWLYTDAIMIKAILAAISTAMFNHVSKRQTDCILAGLEGKKPSG